MSMVTLVLVLMLMLVLVSSRLIRFLLLASLPFDRFHRSTSRPPHTQEQPRLRAAGGRQAAPPACMALTRDHRGMQGPFRSGLSLIHI